MIHLDERIAQKILEYCWVEEERDFRNNHDCNYIEADTLEDCQRWLKWIENESDEGTTHIFYSLLKLQEAIFIVDKTEKERADDEPKLTTCKFFSSEGRNDLGYSFKIYTSKRFYVNDWMQFKDMDICRMYCIDDSIQVEDKFVTTVRWYTSNPHYTFALSIIPSGTLLEYYEDKARKDFEEQQADSQINRQKDQPEEL